MAGHAYKRCGCAAQRDATGRKLACGKPHGSWTFIVDIPSEGDEPRRQHSRGGLATKREAEQALRIFMTSVERGQPLLPTKVTVAVPGRVAGRCRAEPRRDRVEKPPDAHSLLRPTTARAAPDQQAPARPPHRYVPSPPGRRRPWWSTAVSDDRPHSPPGAFEGAQRRGERRTCAPQSGGESASAVGGEARAAGVEPGGGHCLPRGGAARRAVRGLAPGSAVRAAPGELAGLRWSDVDLEQGVLRVLRNARKTPSGG